MNEAIERKLRPPTMDDLQIVFDLMIACDVEDFGEPDSDMGDIKQDWASIDLEKDAFLIFDAEENLLGYASLFANNEDFIFDIYARAGEQKSLIIDQLIVCCETRSLALLEAAQDGQASEASTIISQANTVGSERLSASGYAPKKYHFRMEIELAEAPENKAWPKDYSLRQFTVGQDEHMVYEFIQSAFAQPGRKPPTFEAWSGYMMRKDHFRPDLWFLLMDGKEIVGASLCFEYEDYGWVRQLGVAESLRGQGIGSQLLRHSFGVFFAKGLPRTALVVDSTRPKAQSVYENAGMHQSRRFDDYHKALTADK